MRIPLSLTLSFFVPLLTIALAKSGVGSLAQHPALASQETLSSLQERLLAPLPQREQRILREKLSPRNLSQHNGMESANGDALLLYAISFYARQAEQASSAARAAYFFSLAQQLSPQLSVPSTLQIAQRRLERVLARAPEARRRACETLWD